MATPPPISSSPLLNVEPLPLIPPKDNFWNSRAVQNPFFGMSSREAARLGLRLFGAGGIGTGITVVALTGMGIVAWPVSLLSIPCFLGAMGALWYSTRFTDYENPEELVKYKQDAARMSFDQVGQAYGWTNVLQWGILTPDEFQQKYSRHIKDKDLMSVINYYEKMASVLSQTAHPRYDYQIPAPRESEGKWRQETASKSFEEILNSYSLEKLEKYNILEIGELNKIKELKADFDAIKGEYDYKIAPTEQEYQNSITEHKQTYDQACSHAERTYHGNPAVEQLQGFDLRYIRERENVQNLLIQRQREARARFDAAIVLITKQGKIAYANLSADEKAAYNHKLQELQVLNVQIENEARTQIAEIDARCISDRTRLNAEEAIAKNQKERALQEAKARFEAATFPQRAHKEARIQPFLAAFQASTNDINGRYRAYLRIAGVNHSR